MHPTVSALQSLLEQNADPQKAGPMSAYMRGQFAYLGIKSPEMASLQKGFYAQHGLPAISEIEQILCDLWALPEREFQYAGLTLLDRFEKKLPEEFIETLEFMLVTKSWWDTVDLIAAHAVGTHFRRFPSVRAERLGRWRVSDNFWLRRSAILYQLHYKKETDFPLLCEIIRENLGSNEFFINKAIGRALREYSKVDEQAVRGFVIRTPLNPLSAREALKWLEDA